VEVLEGENLYTCEACSKAFAEAGRKKEAALREARVLEVFFSLFLCFSFIFPSLSLSLSLLFSHLFFSLSLLLFILLT